MAEKGMYLGYDSAGNPVACALYGVFGESKAGAEEFCSEGGLKPRDFPDGDPSAEMEMQRFRETIEKG